MEGIFLDQPILPCTHSTILQLFFETFLDAAVEKKIVEKRL